MDTDVRGSPQGPQHRGQAPSALDGGGLCAGPRSQLAGGGHGFPASGICQGLPFPHSDSQAHLRPPVDPAWIVVDGDLDRRMESNGEQRAEEAGN